ncbi:MAG: YcxB family protein [Algicola sp.]|nr:YcxB family protein [Algicola sp.]
MQIKINIQVQDWLAFQQHIERSAAKLNNPSVIVKSKLNSFWGSLFIWMSLTVVLMLTFQTVGSLHWPTAVAISLIFIAIITLYFINLRGIRKGFKPLDDGIFCGEHELNFDDNGFDAQGEGYHSHYQWPLVKKTERVNGLMLIYLDAFQAIVIPERDLENPNELYQFICQKVSK